VAHRPSSTTESCPVCDTSPTVLLAIRHPVMRRWTGELLTSEHGCWTIAQPRRGEMLAAAIDRTRPAMVIVDSVDFPECCRAALGALPRDRVIVVGPEPDQAYRNAALANGAGGWLSREHVGDELSRAMRRVLGCRHDPCPPARTGAGSLRSASAVETTAVGSGSTVA
jgi:DNA-binding NarL/FixJ family response regulator